MGGGVVGEKPYRGRGEGVAPACNAIPYGIPTSDSSLETQAAACQLPPPIASDLRVIGTTL